MITLQFLEALHRGAPTNKWGWSTHIIGKWRIDTNGIAYTKKRIKL